MFPPPTTALQVIYQYARTVTGDDVSIQYPQPAESTNNVLALFSLKVLNFLPPECVNPDADFFTTLQIMTLGPIFAIPFIFFYYACIERAPDAKMKTLGMTIVLFELVLCGVTTTLFQTYECEDYGGKQHLKAQLSIECAGATYEWWKRYAAFMTLVYPIGVPLGMLTTLFCMRDDIEHTTKRIAELTKATGRTIRVEELRDEDLCEEHDAARVRLVRTLGFLFDKFEADSWWYGTFQIVTRLFETSFLVFMKRRIMKTLFATSAAFLSLVVLREYQPWVKDSDDMVAHASQCLVYCWLFALQAYDALMTIPHVPRPELVWATPLTVLTIAFIGFALKKARDDLAQSAELQRAKPVKRRSTRRGVLEESPRFVIGEYDPARLGTTRELDEVAARRLVELSQAQSRGRNVRVLVEVVDEPARQVGALLRSRPSRPLTAPLTRPPQADGEAASPVHATHRHARPQPAQAAPRTRGGSGSVVSPAANVAGDVEMQETTPAASSPSHSQEPRVSYSDLHASPSVLARRQHDNPMLGAL